MVLPESIFGYGIDDEHSPEVEGFQYDEFIVESEVHDDEVAANTETTYADPTVKLTPLEQTRFNEHGSISPYA